MKRIFRVLGLAIVLLVMSMPRAVANYPTICHVYCASDDQVYYVYTYFRCCGQVSPYDFICPAGGPGYGFAQGTEYC